MRDETLRIIEVLWSGPYTADEIQELNGLEDRGLMAIYGSHPVFGDDALLFIDGTESGRQPDAAADTFSARVSRIEPWLGLLPSAAQFYTGRLGGTAPVSEEAWAQGIAEATRLNTFFHAPPWNGRHVDHHRVLKPTAILNLGRRHRLAMEVSTLWDQSAWAPGADEWQPFATAAPGDES